MSDVERERGKVKVLAMVQRIAPGAEVSAFTLIPAVGRYAMTLQCPHARVQVSIEETDVEDLANNGVRAAQIEAAIRAALIGDICLSL
jgi:hypothetical protein